MTERLVFNASPSSMGSYEDSQLQFYCGYIAKRKPDTNVVKSYGCAGQVVHYVLEEYAKNKNTDYKKLLPEKWGNWSSYGNPPINLYTAYSLSKGGAPLNIVDYEFAVTNGVSKLKNYSNFKTEEQIVFPLIDNEKALVNIKGYIDLQIIHDDGSITIVDWKTSSSVGKGDNFKNQLFHYALSVWKKHGIIPKELVLEYIKIDRTKRMMLVEDKHNHKYDSTVEVFTKEDLLNYEKHLISTVNEIIDKGFDINKYSPGKWDNIFNAHKKFCVEEVSRRLQNKPVEQDSTQIFTIVKYGHKHILKGPITSLLLQGLCGEMSYKEENEYVVSSANRKNNGDWDGWYRLYNGLDNSFPPGLLYIVKGVLNDYAKHKKIYIKIRYDDKRKQKTVIKVPNALMTIKELRPKQKTSADLADVNESGIFSIATGVGKTVLACEIIRRHGMKTLFIVHRTKLSKQATKTIERELDVHCGKLFDGHKDVCDVNVANWQTIIKSLDGDNSMMKFAMENFLKSIDLVIYDECHMAACDSMVKINKFLINCKKRFGLSGTPRRTDGHTMKLHAICGDILMKYQYAAFEDGTLMKPTINFVRFKHNIKPKETLSPEEVQRRRRMSKQNKQLEDYRFDYEDYIINSDERNKLVVEYASKIFKGNKILVLATRVMHVKLLAEMLKCNCITNETPRNERDSIEKEFEDCTEGVLVSTSAIYGTGLDIPDIDRVINISANKSENDTIQKLGRGVRRAADKGKTDFIFIDILDEGIRSLENAANCRIDEFRDYGHKVSIIERDEVGK